MMETPAHRPQPIVPVPTSAVYSSLFGRLLPGMVFVSSHIGTGREGLFLVVTASLRQKQVQ